MEIFLEKENKSINVEVKGSKTILEILKELGINTDSVIIVKNDEVCLEDESVTDADKLKFLSVISGG